MLKPFLRIAAGALFSSALLVVITFVVVRQPAFGRTGRKQAGSASPAVLRRHIDFLTTAARPRSADRPENLDRTAAYIANEFAQARGRVREQAFRARGRTFRNVIVDFGPADGPMLVVGAHYDAYASTGDLPGADDNASGTAGLLELARLLGANRPHHRVELVAFTTEEPPYFGSDEMGSSIHAAALQRSHTAVEGMICLEMIGYFRGQQTWPSPILGAMYPDRADFIAVAGGWADRALARKVKAAIRRIGGVDAYSFTGPHQMLDASDQRNYWRHRWLAVMVTDTAYLRNPNYHTKRDTADTLDYVRMAQVVDGVYAAVAGENEARGNR